MAELSSINFKKSKPNNLAHNERITPPSYLIGSETLQNEVNRTMSEALALKQSMINKAIETYNKNKKPKAPPFKATSYEWSAVVNLKPSSTMDDLEKLAEHLQEKYGFQCYQIAIHRDEGHFENGEKIFNHHAHLEFITLDRDTGRNKFNRRDIKFQTLRDIQTETAEILQMKRGVDKRLSGAKRIEPRVLAALKESEKGEREQTKAKIKELESENFVLKAGNNMLKERERKAKELLGVEFLSENAIKKRFEEERKAWIKEQGRTKEDYARFSNFKKGVLERLKLGENFTDEQIFKELENFNAKIAIVKEQEQKIKDLNEQLERLKELEKENADLKAKEALKTAENEKNVEIRQEKEKPIEIDYMQDYLVVACLKAEKIYQDHKSKISVYLPQKKDQIKKELISVFNEINDLLKSRHYQDLTNPKINEYVNMGLKTLKSFEKDDKKAFMSNLGLQKSR